MKAEYRKDLQRSYLVLQAEGKTEELPYSMRMVTENKIEGLLECTCRRIDSNILYYYDITSQISLAERCQCKKLTGQEILTLFRWFLKAVEDMEDYLLEGKGLCLDPEYIYLDAQMTRASFCYGPQEDRELHQMFQELAEMLLPWVDHQDPQGVQVGYGLYHFAREKEFSADGLHAYLKEAEKASAGPAALPEKRQMREDQDDLWDQQRKHQEALDAFFEEDEPEKDKARPAAVTLGTVTALLFMISGWFLVKNYPQGLLPWGGGLLLVSAAGFFIWHFKRRKEKEKEEPGICERKEKISGERVRTDERRFDVYGDEEPGEDKGEEDMWRREPDETQILNMNQMRGEAAGSGGAYIIEEKYPQQGKILEFSDRPIQFVGHLEGAADLLLPSRAVSRLHARVRKEGSEYYLCDLNSRNGTWVNGRELQGEQEVLLHPGDELRFGDMIYQLQRK